MHGNIFIYYFITLVGYEARNIDMRDLLHNPNPESTLYIPGTIYTNYKFNVSIKLLINKIFIKKKKIKDLTKILQYMTNRTEKTIYRKKSIYRNKKEYRD